MSIKNKQISLKPQDLLVMLKLWSISTEKFTYVGYAESLGLSASEVHACINRTVLSKLVMKDEEGFKLVRPVFIEFLIYGAPFCFPGVLGSTTRGIPTGYAAPPLIDLVNQPDELPPVWPDPQGSVRGLELYPLYPSVSKAASKDKGLYESLALFDALRAGSARERELAQKLLRERI